MPDEWDKLGTIDSPAQDEWSKLGAPAADEWSQLGATTTTGTTPPRTDQDYGPPSEPRLPSDPYAGTAEEMVRPIVLPEGQAQPPDEPGRQISSQPKSLTEWTKFMVGGMLHPIRQTETAVEQTAIALGLAKPGSRLLYSPSKTLETPIVTLPHVPPKEGVAGQLAAGAANAAIDLAQFFLTPEGVLMAGLGAVKEPIRRAVLLDYSAQMATQAPEQFAEAYKAAKAGDLQSATQHFIGGAGGTLFAAHLAKRGAFAEPVELLRPVEESATPKTDQAVESVTEARGAERTPPPPSPTAVVSESGTVPVSAGNIPPARATLPLEEAQGRLAQGVSTTDAGTQASGKLLIDPYSTPMLERLSSIGGPVSKQVAREARQIDADALGLIGQVSQTLDTARQLAGKAFRGGTTWIRGKENVTPNAAIARLHTLEGTDRAAVVASAPPKAQEMVGAIWDANVPAIGGMAQRANVGFAPTGKIQRILTSPGMDIVLSGGGKLWNRLVEGTATANGKTIAETADFFREWKAILDDPSPDMAKIDRIAQDYVRQFPKAITHVKSGPSWIEVLVSDPVDYLKLASERTARAVAFRQVYPNTEAGRQLLTETHKAVLAELPTQIRKEEFNNLMKSLQGHRLDFGPEKFLGAVPGAQLAAETVGTVTRPLKSAMLSLSSLANAAETVIGGPAIFLRFRNVVPLLLKNPARFYKQLEMAGTVDRAARNFAFNPTAPLRSVSRMVSEGVGRVTMNNFFNEVQEFTGSGAARVLADRVRARDLSAGEIADFESVLRAMGFRENFREIARGTDLAGLDQFEKQAANFLSAGHQRPATSSRLANSRAFNSLAWFHRYPQMVVNQFRGIANNLVEDVRTGNKSHMYRDSKLMARFIGGKALQGVLMQLFVTGAKEGIQGIDQKQREAREALASFLLQTTANAVGGSAAIAVRLGERVETGEDLASEAIKISPAVSTGIDLYNALSGKGRYAGLDSFDTASQFLQSKTPAIHAIRSAMGVVGLAQDNPKLRTAIGGYYRWARKQGYRWPDGMPKDAEFTATMRKVTREMERGGDWQEQLIKAVDVKVEKGEDPAKSIKASLGARKILKNQHGAALNAEETDSLRRWLGEDNYLLLIQRDAMVDALAATFKEKEEDK